MKHVILLWTIFFLAVSSVPRCGAIADLLRLFDGTQEVAELHEPSCHDSENRNSLLASIDEAKTHCRCLLEDYMGLYLLPLTHNLHEIAAVEIPREKTYFVNVFRLLHIMTIDSPPPRFALA